MRRVLTRGVLLRRVLSAQTAGLPGRHLLVSSSMEPEEVRSLGYRTDLDLLLLGGSTVTDPGDHLVVRTPDNPLFWWGNFLLLRAAPPPADAPGWIRRFESEFPQASHRALGLDDPQARADDATGFTALGFGVDVDAVMTATSVRAPERPNREASLRPLVGDADWRQHVELAPPYEDEQLPGSEREFHELRAVSRRRVVESGRAVWFGAFLEGQLVAQLGVVAASPGIARFQQVETHHRFRRRGLAGTLVHVASVHAFAELSASTLVMVADPGYPAVRIYRALGFTASEHQLGVSRPPGG